MSTVARTRAEEWRRYPYTPPGTDASIFTCPAAEASIPHLDSNTWYVDARVRGRRSGREYAVAVVYCVMKMLRGFTWAGHYSFAVHDITRRTYATYSDFDYPELRRVRRRPKLRARADHLNLEWDAAAGAQRWRTRRAGGGELIPFSYELEANGLDQNGTPMRVALALETRKPPIPAGGSLTNGRVTVMGQYEAYQYFQDVYVPRGRLIWGDVDEEIEGEIGCIDRLTAKRYLSAHNTWKNDRYKHEWRIIHLDNGWEIHTWNHWDNLHRAAPVPFTGATAVGPDLDVRATYDIGVEHLDFARDPKIIRNRIPLSSGPVYFGHRHRIRLPEWNCALVCEPESDAPAMAFPVQYWTGPVRYHGTLWGEAVKGVGFYERTRGWYRDFDLTDVLRTSLLHLEESEGVGEGTVLAARRLAGKLAEADAMIWRGEPRAAALHLERDVRPDLERLDAPGRERLRQIYADVLTVLRNGPHR